MGAFSDCTGLISLTIPDSVTDNMECAFENCTGLTEVTISDSVTNIYLRAFLNCTGLKSVTIPDSVTVLDDHSFGYTFDYDTDEFNTIPGFTIYGSPDSEAERYADDNGFEFIGKDQSHTHTPGAPVKENVKSATCTESGSYDEVVKCTVCGEKIRRETKAVPATGHDWGEWTVEGDKEVRVCRNDAAQKETRDIEISSVKLDKTSVTLEAGKSVTLTAAVTPANATNNSVTWASSNTKIATVSDGTVKAVKTGIATITVRTANHNGKVTAKKADTATISVKTASGKTAECKLTVNKDTAKSYKFIVNTKTNVFHTNECRAVKKMSKENREDRVVKAETYEEAKSILINEGYNLCGICKN